MTKLLRFHQQDEEIWKLLQYLDSKYHIFVIQRFCQAKTFIK